MAPQYDDPAAIHFGSHHKYISCGDCVVSLVTRNSYQAIVYPSASNYDYIDMLDRNSNGSAESMLDSHGDNKFRQLPCRTYISAGTCPYRDRCVYLHDPRVMSKCARSTTRRKNKDELTGDAFFWPTMSRASVMGRQDGECKPHVIQQYELYSPQNLSQLNAAEKSAYSMWYHFVDNCRRINSNTEFNVAHLMSPVNECTHKARLPVFMSMATGQSARTSTHSGNAASEVVVKQQQMPTAPVVAVPPPPASTTSPPRDSKGAHVDLLPSRYAVRPATNAAAMSGFFSPVRAMTNLGTADRNCSPVSIAEGSFFDGLPPLVPQPLKKLALQAKAPMTALPMSMTGIAMPYAQPIVLYPIAPSFY